MGEAATTFCLYPCCSCTDGCNPDAEDERIEKQESWYCDQCHVEVYQARCVHCGKTKRETR